jgi:molybdate transport system ATP-binding protein
MRISIHNINISIGGSEILKEISFNISPREQWALIGESGSGKSMLAKAIAGKVFYSGKIEMTQDENPNKSIKVELIDQQHRFKNKSNTQNFYYQQRFNSANADETITVIQDLQNLSTNEVRLEKWINAFSLTEQLDKQLILLSNGENKRLQLTKAMSNEPDLLILDNPFIGLDTLGRLDLSNALNSISAEGIKIILIAQEKDLPSCITDVAVLNDGKLYQCRKPIRNGSLLKPASAGENTFKKNFVSHPIANASFNEVIRMVDVNISYGDKKILKNINWTVNKGERWAISGPNGSGKSTLLSLVNADNPQAYANDIYLFERKRGSGESIWDIKKNIGFVSPELHLFFERGITCFQTIASGLFDTIGLFRKTTSQQDELIKKWMNVLEIESYSQKLLQQLPMGKQRLVLLARAMIKNPALLILDEPCQGLDTEQIEKFKNIIDAVCANPQVTLLYVSHYQSEWPKCINKSLKLEFGASIEEINKNDKPT